MGSSETMTAPKLQFLYVFTPGERPTLGRDPSAWTESDGLIADRHFAHLEKGATDGIVLLAGRSQDWVGPAIVILEVDSEQQARSFMEEDPFVSSGLFGADLHPFRIALGKSPQSSVLGHQSEQIGNLESGEHRES
jgi:uncharacterized protein YciI